MLSIDGLFQSNRLAYIHTNDMPGQTHVSELAGVAGNEQTECFSSSHHHSPESVEPEDQR